MNNFICIFGLVSIILIFMYIYMNRKEIKETLQNMDASYVYYEDDNENAFQKKIKDENDTDLSGILQDALYYNHTLFNSHDNIEGSLYHNDEIKKDVKYFNNVSHMLMNYKLKNMVSLNDENKYDIHYK